MKKIALTLCLLLCLSCLFGCIVSDDLDPTPLPPEDLPYIKPIEKQQTLLNEDLANTDYIRPLGRTEFLNDKIYFYNCATGFEITFFGKNLSAKFFSSNTNTKTAPNIVASIDTQVLPDGTNYILDSNLKTINLCQNLAETFHTIKLAKSSEPVDGLTALVSVECDGFFAKPKISTDKPKILMLGSSGISGKGALDDSIGNSSTSSALISYGFLVSRMLDADFEFVTSSGWGLIRGYNDTSKKYNIPNAYKYTGITETGKFTQSLYTGKAPDIAIINVGGNDFNAYINKLTGAAYTNALSEFSKAAADFATTLYMSNPNIIIYWTSTVSSNYGKYAREGFKTLPLNIRNRIITSPFIPSAGSNGDPVGWGNHFGIRTHIRAADTIAKALIDSKLLPLTKARENIPLDYKVIK